MSSDQRTWRGKSAADYGIIKKLMDKKLYINPPLVERAYDWKNGPQPKTRKELDKFFNSPAINKVKDQIGRASCRERVSVVV